MEKFEGGGSWLKLVSWRSIIFWFMWLLDPWSTVYVFWKYNRTVSTLLGLVIWKLYLYFWSYETLPLVHQTGLHGRGLHLSLWVRLVPTHGLAHAKPANIVMQQKVWMLHWHFFQKCSEYVVLQTWIIPNKIDQSCHWIHNPTIDGAPSVTTDTILATSKPVSAKNCVRSLKRISPVVRPGRGSKQRCSSRNVWPSKIWQTQIAVPYRFGHMTSLLSVTWPLNQICI